MRLGATGGYYYCYYYTVCSLLLPMACGSWQFLPTLRRLPFTPFQRQRHHRHRSSGLLTNRILSMSNAYAPTSMNNTSAQSSSTAEAPSINKSSIDATTEATSTTDTTMSHWSCEATLEAFSLQSLQERAELMVSNHSSVGKVCMAIAGGGGHALSTLAATPGASKLLLEGTVTYDRGSFQAYVGEELPDNFSYSSMAAAKMTSQAALLRAMQLQSGSTDKNFYWDMLKSTVGIGSASTLKTTTANSLSKSGRPSSGAIVATRANGMQFMIQLTLNCPEQKRFEQDLCVSHMIYNVMEQISQQVLQTIDQSNDNSSPSSSLSSSLKSSSSSLSCVDTKNGEKAILEGVTMQQSTLDTLNAMSGDPRKPDPEKGKSSDAVLEAARRILSDDAKVEAVLLTPAVNQDGETYFEALAYPVLPKQCLIFPGSFNPPHQGHIALARAAVEEKTDKSPDNLSPVVVFELAIYNADKPAMEPEEVSRRVSQFNTDMMKKFEHQWGILLTRAPLFSQKIEVVKKFAAQYQSQSQWSFIIGTDTMVRILNPKYYDNDYDKMIEAQRTMGVDFVVGGRLEQSKKSSKEAQEENHERFITGKEELNALPQDVQQLFTLIEEDDFRVDISSTELRKKRKE